MAFSAVVLVKLTVFLRLPLHNKTDDIWCYLPRVQQSLLQRVYKEEEETGEETVAVEDATYTQKPTDKWH